MSRITRTMRLAQRRDVIKSWSNSDHPKRSSAGAKTPHNLAMPRSAGIIMSRLVAALGDVFPTHRKVQSRWGGALIVGGAALLGFAFPVV
jgi:hypothetical protein